MYNSLVTTKCPTPKRVRSGSKYQASEASELIVPIMLILMPMSQRIASGGG